MYTVMMRAAPRPSPQNPPPAGHAARVIGWSLAAIVLGPPLAYGCLWAVVVGPWIVHDFIDSGSTTGDAALDRAQQVLPGGTWKAVATDARAAWTASDFHGDASQYATFVIPVAEVPAFEAAVRSGWERDPHYRGPDQVKDMPVGSNAPDWMLAPLPEGVYYQCGNDAVGVSRTTGRVLVSRIET